MKITVPLVPEKIENAREEFVEWLEHGYKMDIANPRKVNFKEWKNGKGRKNLKRR